MKHLLALLAATVALGAAAQAAPPGQARGLIQLLPVGEFAARDGRPGPGQTWKLDDAQGAALAASINAVAAQTPIVIDYEHQTLTAMSAGHKAPAAGWIHTTRWEQGKGLFAEVEWTAAAAQHIQAGEYKFISPVMSYAPDGRVTGIALAALVNFPALLGMEPAVAALSGFAAASSTHNPETRMDLAQLLALLGLAANATSEQITAHVAALKARPTAAVPAELVTALGLTGTPDAAAALSAVQALKQASAGTDASTLQAMQALQQQVAVLSAASNETKVNGLIDKALAEHKLVPAQRAWALNLGLNNLPQLEAYLSSAPVLAGLQGQSGGQEPGGGQGGTAALSATQALIAAQLGIKPEDYAKQLKAAA